MCALTRHSLGALHADLEETFAIRLGSSMSFALFALDVPGEEANKEDLKDGNEEKEKKEENSD